MDTYAKYRNARDTAWKFLIDNKLVYFPIDIKSLLDKYNVTTITREQIKEHYAITFKINNHFVIIYSKKSTPQQLRFSLMHELGHIILGHINENDPNEYMENEANIFASRVLMPMIIIHTEKLFSVQQISNFFGVSEEAAELRLNRYNAIKDRKKFFVSHLEVKYYELYQSFSH